MTPGKIGQTSIDEEEVAKFSAMAAEWWDPNGKFAPLHKFNPTRLGYIRDVVTGTLGLDDASLTPFQGVRFLDIGCGGGLLSEPMARLGADVVAADASEANIKTAMTHAAEQGLVIDYRATTAEALADAGEQFDVILNMEVIEHVKSPRAFLASCAQLLKPGGIMLVATLNRTPKALLTAKIGAEYVLGWLPRGTHDWTKFITPQEMDRYLKFAGLSVTETCGVVFKPLSNEWVLSPMDLSVNYMAVAQKP